MDRRRLVALVGGAALLVGSLGAAFLALVQSSGFLGSGGDAAYMPLVPLFLLVVGVVPFGVAAVSGAADWLTGGALALGAGVGVMAVTFSLGVGGVTAAVGVTLSIALARDEQQQLGRRLGYVVIAAAVAFPALLFLHLDGWGYLLVPLMLAVGSIALADRAAAPRAGSPGENAPPGGEAPSVV